MKHLMFLLALGFCLGAGSEPVAAAPPDGVDTLHELISPIPLEATLEVVVLEVTAPSLVEVALMVEVPTVATGDLDVKSDPPDSLRTPALLPDKLPDIHAGRGHPERWCNTRQVARQGWQYMPARAGPKRE